MRYLSCLLITACLLHGAPAAARTTVDDVLPLLKGYEWTLDEARISRLPDDAWRALLTIARDPERHNFIRSRAREALTLYPNETVRRWFVQGIASSSRPVTRRELAAAYCRGFAAAHGAEVETELAPLLGAADPHLRVAVARCLQRLSSPTARERLRRYRASAATWEREALGVPAPVEVRSE